MDSQRDSAMASPIGRLGLMPAAAANAEFASVYIVSENYFQVLDVAAIQGRTFDSLSPTELEQIPSVLIGDNHWRRRFASHPEILGRTIQVNSVAVKIIGTPAFGVPIGLEPQVQANRQWLRN